MLRRHDRRVEEPILKVGRRTPTDMKSVDAQRPHKQAPHLRGPGVLPGYTLEMQRVLERRYELPDRSCHEQEDRDGEHQGNGGTAHSDGGGAVYNKVRLSCDQDWSPN